MNHNRYLDFSPYFRRPIASNNLHRRHNKYSLTCNCSWGTVPEGLNISLNRLKYKIVGGNEIDDSENYPMMAGLQLKESNCVICGATILTEFHALTAAHCIFGENVTNLQLAVGIRHNCRQPNDGGQYLSLLEPAYVHEYYDEKSNNQDIAIVVTQERIIFRTTVGPTCIYPHPLSLTDNYIFLALGWGKLSEEEDASPELVKVFLNSFDIEECKDKVPPEIMNDNWSLQMCTYTIKKDTCGGDSGGPLFIVDRAVNRLAQVALISMGVGCARVDEPGVNTALYPYIGWMQWTIENSMRTHYPEDYYKCGYNKICYSTDWTE
ncbi:unnamed protein product [Nezara viridula]|uniref:Peptidase S1 domain-containing protein n=1 Tax=Nezara viridula TaxID=85310 RepID=A0A9P0EHW4_NEZVI|nr:unnamed protein product [Nezara viridula]